MINKKKKRGYLQISFAWLFAIIVGAFILFLAIYIAYQMIDSGKTQQDLELGKELDILLNPLETSFETSTSTSIRTPLETRIFIDCELEDSYPFGVQKIRVSQKSLNKWSETNTGVASYNRYVFVNKYVEGDKFYLFSKPFETPFKIADLTYLTSSRDKYCFINPPKEIEQEIDNLNQNNLLIKTKDKNECENLSDSQKIEVCFSGSCEISVDYSNKKIIKKGDELRFSNNALMYAGIFSDKELYECQVKRIMKKTSILTKLYSEKIEFVSFKGCDASNIKQELSDLKIMSNKVANGEMYYISLINDISQELKDKQEGALCRIW